MAEPTLTLGVMDSIMEVFNDTLNGGGVALTPGALQLARQLAAAEVVIVSVGMFFARAEALQRMLWSALAIGFFAILITNLNLFSEAFMNTLVAAGLQVGGGRMTLQEFLRPSSVVSQGVTLTGPLILYVENLKGKWASVTNYPALQSYAWLLQIAWFCYILQACHIVVAVIEFKIITIKALVLIPWGLFSKTAFMAEGAIGGIISSAVRLGVLAAVVAITMKALTHPRLSVVAALMDATWNTVLTHLGISVMLLIINWVAPNYAASLTGMGPAITGQALVHTVLAVGGAAAAGTRAGLSAVRGAQAQRRPRS
jgi:type IV secretion system protein TrbL